MALLTSVIVESGCIDAILSCVSLSNLHIVVKDFSPPHAILLLSQLAASTTIKRLRMVVYCHYERYLHGELIGELPTLTSWLNGDLPPALREIHLEVSCYCGRPHDIVFLQTSPIGRIYAALQAQGYLKTSRSKDDRLRPDDFL